MITIQEFEAVKQRCRHIITSELSLAGFKLDEDGDYVFRYERHLMTLVFHPDDPAFLWIRLPGFYGYPGGEPGLIEKVDRVINTVNRQCKLVKLARSAGPDQNGDYGVSASVSVLLTELGAIDADSFERYLNMNKHGATTFMDAMSGDEPALPPEPPRVRVTTH